MLVYVRGYVSIFLFNMNHVMIFWYPILTRSHWEFIWRINPGTILVMNFNPHADIGEITCRHFELTNLMLLCVYVFCVCVCCGLALNDDGPQFTEIIRHKSIQSGAAFFYVQPLAWMMTLNSLMDSM